MRLWTASLVIFLAFPAIAQSSDPVTPDDELSEVTVTATRRATELLDTPTAITVITARQASEQSQTTMADLLKGATGVAVRATNPSAGSPVVRGVTGRDLLLLVDGFRLSHAFMRPNTQYEGYIDPLFIQRLEVVRGPSSVLYGSDALGGVSNVITAQFDPTRPLVFSTSYGTNPASVTSHLRLNLGDQQANYQVGLTYRSFGDVVLGNSPDPEVFYPNEGRTLANSGYEYYGANFKGNWQLAPDQSLHLTAQYSQIPTVSRQDAVIQGYGPEVAAAERGFAPQARTFVLAEYRQQFKETWLDDLRFQVGFQQILDSRFQRNYGPPRPSFENPNPAIPSANKTLEQNRSDLWGTSLALNSTLGNHRLTYGLEAYGDRVTSNRQIANDTTGTASDPAGPRYVDGSTEHQYGAFIQDEITWAPQFTTFLGLRYSLVDLDIPQSNERPNSSGFSRSFQALTGSLGAVYRLNPEVSLVFNLGQGFRAPNVNDLGEAGSRRATDIAIPNSDLSPEKVFSVDGGIKWSGANFSGEFIGFWSRYTDRITSEPVGTQVNSDGTTSEILQTKNEASEIVWGLEFGGRYRINPNWSVFATANFVYGEFPLAGETSIPPFNGLLGVRYEPLPDVYIEPYVLYANAQERLSENDRADPRINPNGTPGYILANLRLGFPLNPTTLVRLNVDNLFNTSYREHSSSLDGAGFGVTLGIEYHL